MGIQAVGCILILAGMLVAELKGDAGPVQCLNKGRSGDLPAAGPAQKSMPGAR